VIVKLPEKYVKKELTSVFDGTKINPASPVIAPLKSWDYKVLID
jgi:hypothetical protein